MIDPAAERVRSGRHSVRGRRGAEQVPRPAARTPAGTRPRAAHGARLRPRRRAGRPDLARLRRRPRLQRRGRRPRCPAPFPGRRLPAPDHDHRARRPSGDPPVPPGPHRRAPRRTAPAQRRKRAARHASRPSRAHGLAGPLPAGPRSRPRRRRGPARSAPGGSALPAHRRSCPAGAPPRCRTICPGAGHRRGVPANCPPPRRASTGRRGPASSNWPPTASAIAAWPPA